VTLDNENHQPLLLLLLLLLLLMLAINPMQQTNRPVQQNDRMLSPQLD
jgi:hypothetical protein